MDSFCARLRRSASGPDEPCRRQNSPGCFSGCANDLGLLSEGYDTAAGRMAGNYPLAFSHLALVRAADAIRAMTR